jgi:hypothetical protein
MEVALFGQDPASLRSERIPGGWRYQGVAALYSDQVPLIRK